MSNENVDIILRQQGADRVKRDFAELEALIAKAGEQGKGFEEALEGASAGARKLAEEMAEAGRSSAIKNWGRETRAAKTDAERLAQEVRRIGVETQRMHAMASSPGYVAAIREQRQAQQALRAATSETLSETEKLQREAARRRSLAGDRAYIAALQDAQAAQAELAAATRETQTEAEQLAEAIRSFHQEAADTRALRANKDYVRALKEARRAQDALDRATESMGDKITRWLEVAENVEGFVGVLGIATDAVTLMWDTWRRGAAAASAEQTRLNQLISEGQVRQLQDAGGGRQSARQIGGAITATSLAGLPPQTVELVQRLAKAATDRAIGTNELDGGDPEAVAQAQEQYVRELTQAFRAGNYNSQVVADLMNNEQQTFLRELDAKAREVGTTVDSLNPAQIYDLMAEGMIRGAERLNVIDTQEVDRMVGFYTDFQAGVDDLARLATRSSDGRDLSGLVEGVGPFGVATLRGGGPTQEDVQEAQANMWTGATQVDARRNMDRAHAIEQEASDRRMIALQNVERLQDGILFQVQQQGEGGLKLAQIAQSIYLDNEQVLASHLGITEAQAEQIMNALTIEERGKVIENLRANAVDVERSLIGQERARIEQQKQTLGLLTDQEKRELAIAEVKVEQREQAILNTVRYEEYLERLNQGVNTLRLSLAEEQAALGVQEARRALMSDAEQARLDELKALNAIQTQAAEIATTTAEYQGLLAKGIAAEWGREFGAGAIQMAEAVGLSEQTLKNMVPWAETLINTLNAASMGTLLSEGAELLSGMLGEGLGGVGGVAEEKTRRGGSSSGFDMKSFIADLRRQQQDVAIEVARSTEEIRAGVGDSPLASALLEDGELARHVDAQLAQAAVEIDRWREEKLREARGNDEALALIEDVAAARVSEIETEMNGRAYAAGWGALKAWGQGLADAGEQMGAGLLADIERAREQTQTINDVRGRANNSRRRERAGTDPKARLEVEREEALERLEVERQAEQQRLEQMGVWEQVRVDQIRLWRDEELEIEREHQARLTELRAEQWDDATTRADEALSVIQDLESQLDPETANARWAVVLASARGAARGMREMAQALSETQRLRAEYQRGEINAMQASVGGVDAFLQAGGRATQGIVKNTKTQARILGGIEVARGIAAIVTNPWAVPVHAAAAASFFSVSGGGAGTRPKESAKEQQRAAGRRTALTNDGAALRRDGGGSQVINQVYVGNVLGNRGAAEQIAGMFGEAYRDGSAARIPAGMVSANNRVLGR